MLVLIVLLISLISQHLVFEPLKTVFGHYPLKLPPSSYFVFEVITIAFMASDFATPASRTCESARPGCEKRRRTAHGQRGIAPPSHWRWEASSRELSTGLGLATPGGMK